MAAESTEDVVATGAFATPTEIPVEMADCAGINPNVTRLAEPPTAPPTMPELAASIPVGLAQLQQL